MRTHFLALMMVASTSLLGLFMQVFAQPSQGTYCNGQIPQIEGTQVYANGRRMQISGDDYYPNGIRTQIGGESVYPNGQRMEIGEEQIHLSGQRVRIGNDLYYPNGQRVRIGNECYFQSGTRMKVCPDQVAIEDNSENVFLKGTLDLKQQKLKDLQFELREFTQTISWQLDSQGKIIELETRCDQSLF